MNDENSPAFKAGLAAGEDLGDALDEWLDAVGFDLDKEAAARNALQSFFFDAIAKAVEYGMAAGTNATVEVLEADNPSTNGVLH